MPNLICDPSVIDRLLKRGLLTKPPPSAPSRVNSIRNQLYRSSPRVRLYNKLYQSKRRTLDGPLSPAQRKAIMARVDKEFPPEKAS